MSDVKHVRADRWYLTSTYSGDIVEGPFDTRELAEDEFDLGRAIESGQTLIEDGRYDPTPVVGFKVSLTIATDNIPDLMAYGRKLRDAEDGGSEDITDLTLAAREVGWLFAASGVSDLIQRGGLYAESADVAAEPIYE